MPNEPQPNIDLPAARRSPRQERSQETVQRIFASAARLLGRGVPFEEITTGMIADEAGVSVGALYRFFPDKQAIVDAIAIRSMEEFQGWLMRDLAMSPPTDGPSFLGAVIDSFVGFLDAHAHFRTIAYGGRHISRGTREEQSGGSNKPAGPDAGAMAFVRQFMISGLGLTPCPELELRLRVATEAGDRLLGFAYEQTEPAEKQRIVDEMKRLLGLYLFVE